MLIIGAKGLAQELIIIFDEQQHQDESLVFYDDVSEDLPDKLFGTFPILTSEEQAKNYFKLNNKYALGIGDPLLRYKLAHKFNKMGGELTSILSNTAIIGKFNTQIDKGCIVSALVCVSSSIHLKTGSFINASSVIGHDSIIGEYAVICPSCNIGGHCEIGDLSFIGTGSIIYPNVKIGKNVSIAAGSIVRKNIPDNAIVHGNDGKVIKIKNNTSNYL